MLESMKDLVYRYTGVFPPKLPRVRTLEEPDAEMLKTIEDLQTVCLFLGPNRNLTTLTAAVLALHPSCQVLSHAGNRILPAEELNFLKDYSPEKFRRFCQFALVMSQNGDKGSFGGSMVMTHAFRDHRKMRGMFRRRYGRSLIKENIECLVWKEAHRVDDFVAEHDVDLNALMKKNEKLRFIMPVRNPIHVALSYSEKDGIRRKYFSDLDAQDLKPLLDTVLEKMEAAIRFQQATPERMLVFFEDEISPDLFIKMAELLKTRPDQRWLRDAVACFEVKPPDYQVPASLTDYYELRVSDLFGDMPKLATRFLNYGVK